MHIGLFQMCSTVRLKFTNLRTNGNLLLSLCFPSTHGLLIVICSAREELFRISTVVNLL